MTSTGRFVWRELHTTDRAKAIAFYKKLFSWDVNDVSMGPGEPYGLCLHGGKDFAGIMKSMAPEGVPSHWISYIAVPDVDASLAKAKSLGGKELNPAMDIPDVGRFALVADPQGAAFALFKGTKESPESTAMPEPGQFCWNELLTKDPAGAAKFYADLFGYGVKEEDMGPMGIYRLLMRGDQMAAGIMQMPPMVPVPHWLSYIAVADCDASANMAKELGATIHMPPTDIPNIGRFSVFQDPTGAAIAIIKGIPPTK